MRHIIRTRKYGHAPQERVSATDLQTGARNSFEWDPSLTSYENHHHAAATLCGDDYVGMIATVRDGYTWCWRD